MLDWKEIEGRFAACGDDTRGEYVVEGAGDSYTLRASVKGRRYEKGGMTKAQAFSYAEELDISAVLL